MQKTNIHARFVRYAKILVAHVVLIGVVFYSDAPSQSTTQKGTITPMQASGTFDVKLTPQTDDSGDSKLGRMTLEKQFHGDLEGTSKGQMLTGMTEIKNSGGYVAIEKFSGTLKGRSGTFIFQHIGTMNRGAQQLSITVVPDSGTGQLAGIAGNFNIKIADGKHSYVFEYTLPETH